MTNAKVWKTEEQKYSVQFDNVKPKDRRTILSIFSSWKEVGSGFHKDGTEVFIFSKQYQEEESLFKFLKTIPFPLVSEGKSGKTKKVKTKCLTNNKKSATIHKGRTCSKCGHEGHNSRTCKV